MTPLGLTVAPTTVASTTGYLEVEEPPKPSGGQSGEEIPATPSEDAGYKSDDENFGGETAGSSTVQQSNIPAVAAVQEESKSKDEGVSALPSENLSEEEEDDQKDQKDNAPPPNSACPPPTGQTSQIPAKPGFTGIARLFTWDHQAVIHRVFPGSPAAQAGICKDDRLLFVGAKKITSQEDAIYYLERLHAGEVVPLTWRHGSEIVRGKVPLWTEDQLRARAEEINRAK